MHLNVLPPSIEPRASGHIIEQQELIGKYLKMVMHMKTNGSVYFDVRTIIQNIITENCREGFWKI